MRIFIVSLFSFSLFTGCASLKLDTSGSKIITPLCNKYEPDIETIVLWGTLWRANQKEPLLRESMAKQGIEKFVNETQCINVRHIQQINIDKKAPTNKTLIGNAAKQSANKLLFILVRELGPTLELGIPSIIKGHTEVVLEVKVIDLISYSITNSSKVHWRHGGNFVIKGTNSLPDDMASALHSLLTSNGG